MLKVGLTGGIASGKSVVGEMFVSLGAHLTQADRIAHELMLPGQKVYDEVVDHFGREILNPDRSVNRSKLAEAAFGSPNSTGKNNSRLIIEAGAAKDFDRLIVVTCNEDQRAVRFAARQKIPIEDARKEVARRMAAQLPDAEKIKAADYVIANSGTVEATREQVDRIWQHMVPARITSR
jgi:dephospho-CoA kinase